VKLLGAMIDIDESTGRALRIERVADLFTPAEEETPAPTPAAAA
jgi:hypothetical protein